MFYYLYLFLLLSIYYFVSDDIITDACLIILFIYLFVHLSIYLHIPVNVFACLVILTYLSLYQLALTKFP